MSFLVILRFLLALKEKVGKGLHPNGIWGGGGSASHDRFKPSHTPVFWERRGWDLVQRVSHGI